MKRILLSIVSMALVLSVMQVTPEAGAINLPVCSNGTPFPTAFRGDPNVFCAPNGGFVEGDNRMFCNDRASMVPTDGTVDPATYCTGRGGYTPDTSRTGGVCNRSFLGLPAWYAYLELDDVCNITGPKGPDGKMDWPKAIGYISVAAVEILLRIASLVAVGYVIYGGFRFILSQGDPENAKSARQTVINALIGLVIALAAAAIVSFVANRLTS